MNHRNRLLAIPAVAFLLSSCATTRIQRVLADPSRYQNRSVSVQGTVTNSVGAFAKGVYQVDDGTGKIFVLSDRGVPSKGSRVKVSGSVTPGLSVLGQSFGTAIRERSHRVTD